MVFLLHFCIKIFSLYKFHNPVCVAMGEIKRRKHCFFHGGSNFRGLKKIQSTIFFRGDLFFEDLWKSVKIRSAEKCQIVSTEILYRDVKSRPSVSTGQSTLWADSARIHMVLFPACSKIVTSLSYHIHCI